MFYFDYNATAPVMREAREAASALASRVEANGDEAERVAEQLQLIDLTNSHRPDLEEPMDCPKCGHAMESVVHQGIEVDRPPRPVTIHEFTVTGRPEAEVPAHHAAKVVEGSSRISANERSRVVVATRRGGALERVRIPPRHSLGRAPLRVQVVHRHCHIVCMPITNVCAEKIGAGAEHARHV